MNFIGKLLIVAILIMSLVFMGLSMAVYATHKNWKVASENLKKTLDTTNAEKTAAVNDLNRQIEEKDRQNTTQSQQLVKSEAERASLAERNVQQQTELEGLRQNQRDHIAAVAATQAINQNLAGEVGELRQKIRTEQKTRDSVFKQALDATEQLYQEKGIYDATRERNEQLVKQVAGMTSVMQSKGIDPATDPGAVAPNVEGIVSQIRQTPGAQLVEVSIGSDDGLKTGNTLEVSRGDKYLGRLEIIETSPDKSVARVDRRYQQGAIQEGDRVATRIKL